ncbi:MAG: PHP domain-containing protein [Lachnospiraceae bacterium]|nr:PHP domain-containing protein [Lachnospiraceae bacterium]
MSDFKYKYDLHVHTYEASACASMTAAEQVKKYKEAGYDGIITTDHFFGGNTRVDRSLPWKEKIEAYCKGYEHAKEEGDKIGLKVFFGVEQGFNGTDFLIYGLDKEWLIAHPEFESANIEETYKMVHGAGGMMVHAHPFREADYIKGVTLRPDCIDAVETWNRGNRLDDWNIKAEEYADKYGLPHTGGGDTHNLPDTPAGIITKEPLNSWKDYKKLILERGEYEIIHIHRG